MTSSASCASPKRVAHYASALQSFASSTSAFRVLHHIPARITPKQQLPPPTHLYILDSSFNPPTLAHLRIAKSALQNDTHPEAKTGSKRLLLLLATQNADKAPKPAAFEQRLMMMENFAEELLARMGLGRAHTSKSGDETQIVNEVDDQEQTCIQGIDIALTTRPYFVDKSDAIAEHADYPASKTTQIHLTGFDTLIRIMNPKYYPPHHDLRSIQPFLAHHRLRVTYRTEDTEQSSPRSRTDSQLSSKETQDAYLKAIASGDRAGDGALPSWIVEDRIMLVEGRRKGEEVISSTKVREALNGGNPQDAARLVTEDIADYAIKNSLYA